MTKKNSLARVCKRPAGRTRTFFSIILYTFSALLLAPSLYAQLQPALENTWVPNFRVANITHGDGKVFLGGEFDWVGPSHPTSIVVMDNALADQDFPTLGDNVTAAVSDDAGGWYISGYLNTVIHIKASKQIETLPLTTDGTIGSLVKVGNVLYLGGAFDVVNTSITRHGLASYDLVAGTVTSWDPDCNGSVAAIAVSGSTVYVGGNFTTVGGQSRESIAALDASTGLATSWNANVSSSAISVRTIHVNATGVYFGGLFPNVGGGAPARRNFAAVNTTTGALLPFNPRPDAIVTAATLDGNTIYIGGNFTQIAGVTKPSLAALDITSGSLTGFNVTFDDPNYTNSINDLAVSGQKLFVGGSFRVIDAVEQPRLAVVNKLTGALETTVDRKLSSQVSKLSLSGGLLLAGGFFQGISGLARINNSVALDETTGEGSNWNPQFPPAPVGKSVSRTRIHYQDFRVYFVQDISDGTSVLGAVTSSDGALVPGWSATVDGPVDAWAFSDDAIYLGGDFTMVNGVEISTIAAVDLVTGALTGFSVPSYPLYSEGDNVNSMLVYNNVLYVAGKFHLDDNGVDRFDLGAWNAITGEVMPWAPIVSLEPFEYVTVAAVDNNSVYLGGGVCFRVDAVTGEPDGWEVNFPEDGSVQSVIVRDTSVFIAGAFGPGLVRVGKANADIAGWQPDIQNVYDQEGEVAVLDATATKLLAGGSYRYNVGTVERTHYAEFLLNPSDFAPYTDKNFISVCEGVAASFTVVGTGILSYQWQKLNTTTGLYENVVNGINYGGATTKTLTITSLTNGTYDFRCTVETESDVLNTNVATLDVKPLAATPVIEIVSGSTTLCPGESVTLEGPSGGYTYDWSNGESTQQIEISTTGAFTLRVTDSGGCTSLDSDEVIVSTGTCNEPPDIQEPSVSTPVGGIATTNLETLLSDPDDNLDLTTLRIVTQPASGAPATIDGDYTLRIDYTDISFAGTDHLTLEVCDLLGSCVQKQLAIEVVGEILVYDGISPNGDGKNDVFYIQYIDMLPTTKSNKVTIFNRWGDLVFETTDYNNGSRSFRGQNKNGDDLPSGTYYFKIDFASNADSRTGFITLKR